MDVATNPGLVLKTTPPKLRKSLLERERLRRLRADGDDVAVLLVEAPAGHGKTSLLLTSHDVVYEGSSDPGSLSS